MTAPTSHWLRLATFLAPALICASLLGGCVGASQKVATSKEQGDNSTASDQQVQQSGFFNFAKTTSSAMISGASVLFSMLVIIYMNHKANGAVMAGYRQTIMELVEVIMRMIPLVNTDDHDKTATAG